MKTKIFDEAGFKAAHAELYKVWLKNAPPPQQEDWYRAWKFVVVQYMDNKPSMYFHHVAGIRVDVDFLVIRQGAFPDETITRVNLETVRAYVVEVDA